MTAADDAEDSSDVVIEQDDVTEGDIVWKEPAEDWYKDFEYTTKDGIIYLTKAKDSLSGNVIIPAKAKISGKEYKTVLQPPADSFGERIWQRDNDKLTGLKFTGGVKVKGSCYNLFGGCSYLETIDVSGLDTSDITNFGDMFSYCTNLKNLNLKGMDTGKATDLWGLFCVCSSITEIDVSSLKTSNVTSMSSMFSGCSSLKTIDVSGFDTSKVQYMSSMFAGCKSLEKLDVSNFSTSNVESFASMFSGCEILKTLDLSSFDTSNARSFCDMFEYCPALEDIKLQSFNTRKATDFSNMFMRCSSLKELDLSSFRTKNVTNMAGMFCECAELTGLELGNFDTRNVKDMSGMFAGCENLTKLDLSSFDTSAVESFFSVVVGSDGTGYASGSTYGMFENCRNLQEIDLRGFVFTDKCWLEYADMPNVSSGFFRNGPKKVYLPVKWAKKFDWYYSEPAQMSIYYAGSREEWDALENKGLSGIEITCDYTEGMKIPEPEIEHSALDPQPVFDESTTDLYLVKGQKFKLSEDGWSSSDKKILSVSKKGAVVAKKVSDEVTLVKGDRKVNVHISQPTWKKKSCTSYYNLSGALENFGFDYDEDHLEVYWVSNKPDVVAVDQNGDLTFAGKGSAVITAYVNGVAYKFSAKSKSFAKKPDFLYRDLGTEGIHMKIGQTKTLACNGGKKMEWSAVPSDVIQIVNKYKFKGMKAGAAVLDAKIDTCSYGSFKIYVEDAAITTEGIVAGKKNKYTADLSLGDEKQIEYVYVHQAVLYKSSDPSVAFIDEHGKLVARKAGKAKLTAKINGESIQITVNVSEKN